MVKAVRVHETGGPEVLRPEEVDLSSPGPGEALIRHTAIGLNFIDTYRRSGLYPPPHLPFVPGDEAAGVIEAIGPDVAGFAPGDRVAYVLPFGAYAEKRIAPADRLVKLPESIPDRIAAAIMLKGLTAQYLLRRTYKVEAGTTLLFHAAAGGVGSIAGQWAKALGATVIGTVGSEAKIATARDHGCDHVLVTGRDDIPARVREITGGRGCDVVYDSVGRDTFPLSLDCLKRFGLWVTYGQSSGPLPPIESQILSQKGSLFMTRPTIYTHIADPQDLRVMAADLFDVVGRGLVKVAIHQTYPLAEAAFAHRALGERRTTGATVLLP